MTRKNVIPFVFLLFCCRFPLGPTSERKAEEKKVVFVQGAVVCDGESLDNVSVAVFPVEGRFSSIVVSPLNLSRSAYALGISEQKHFLLELNLPKIETRYFIISGLGMHNKDKNVVQRLRLRFEPSSLKLSSDTEFTIDSTFNSGDTLSFVLDLTEKVYLYVPGTGAIWQSGDSLLLHPTLDNPITIRWFYRQTSFEPPSHTRFIFILWSLEQGLLYYSPSTYDELLQQPPGITSKIFPETPYENSLLITNKSYRITILAINNITDPDSIIAVSTELLFDGKFTYTGGI